MMPGFPGLSVGKGRGGQGPLIKKSMQTSDPGGSPDRIQREESLRIAVLAGNKAAWRTWCTENFGDLYYFVRWRCGGRRDWADEITQDTWLTAARAIAQFSPERGSFQAWLRGIAVNVLRNRLRQQKLQDSRRQPDSALRSASGETELTRGDQQRSEKGWHVLQQQQRVAAALNELSDHDEALLRAKYFDGLTVAEIAANQGKTVKSVECSLSRARRAFRKGYLEAE